MAKFSRMIAGASAAALITTGIAAPMANAASNTMLPDGRCSITVEPSEASVIGSQPGTETMTQSTAKGLLGTYDEQMAQLDKLIKENDGKGSIATQREIDKAKAKLPIFKEFRNVLDACVKGKAYPTAAGEGSSEVTLTDEDGKLNGAGIGVVVASSVVGVLALIAIAVPLLKNVLPANIASMLP